MNSLVRKIHHIKWEIFICATPTYNMFRKRIALSHNKKGLWKNRFRIVYRTISGAESNGKCHYRWQIINA